MPITLAIGVGAHDVAARLAHLVVLEQQPAVRENALRQRQVRGHQERRPVDGVEAHDLLADQVQIGRPQILRPQPRSYTSISASNQT